MSVLVAARETGADALSTTLNFRECEVADALPASGWSGNRDDAPVVFVVGAANSGSHAPLPRDVLDLLRSTALFAEAILQLDRADVGCAPRACYDALADLKRSLNQVAWSRALV